MPNQSVTEFVDTLAAVRDHITNGRAESARESYARLHELYEQINASDAAHHHKKIAYDQITIVYSQLQDLESRPPNYAAAVILAGILFVTIGIMLTFKPELVGLTVFDSSLTEPVGITFTENTAHALVLDSAPKSLRATGRSDGPATIWLVTPTDRRLVADLDGGTFTMTCDETCDLTGTNRAITLEIDVSNSMHLESVTYKTGANTAPQWQGSRTNYIIKDGFSLDLANLFHDPDGDSIVYLVTAADDIATRIDGSIVTFTRTGGSGERSVTIIASDLNDVTRIPLTLTLE